MGAAGYAVVPFGAVAHGVDDSWVDVVREASAAVASGRVDVGVFCCWSGTGACMTANKHRGLRAALCGDPQTARASRIWNHANVLCLSNRLLSVDLSTEILSAWFETGWDERGSKEVTALTELEAESLPSRKR